MERLLDFLKKYSDIDIDFIRKFLEIRQGDHLHAPFSIDSDIVANWFKTTKGKMKKTLVKTYILNVDYIILSPKDKEDISKHGGHNKELILMTPDTFKMICMKSKTRNAQKIRYYYVTLEKLVEIYKDDIIKNQNDKIEILERNLKKIEYPVEGAIYVIQLTPDDKEGFKIGKTEDMNKRLKTHKTSMKDDPTVVYIFYSSDINRLEKCVKLALQYYIYKKDKEYYKITRDEIEEAIKDCDHVISKYICKECNVDETNDKKMSRRSHDKEMIVTTVVEYGDVDYDQIGGYDIYHYNVIYQLNKMRYGDLFI